MADKIRVWFDAEGDFLEVRFSDAPGYMKETCHDAVMERVDDQGRVIGFSIMQVSKLARQKPLTAELVPPRRPLIVAEERVPYGTRKARPRRKSP